MSALIVVEKAGERLPIHPSTLDEHNRLGWNVSAEQSYEAAVGPLDHDGGDGKKSGAKPPADPEMAELRQQYQAKFGKKPFAGWKADELREKLAAE